MPITNFELVHRYVVDDEIMDSIRHISSDMHLSNVEVLDELIAYGGKDTTDGHLKLEKLTSTMLADLSPYPLSRKLDVQIAPGEIKLRVGVTPEQMEWMINNG